MRGRGRAGRHQLQGLVVFGLGLALTSGRWRCCTSMSGAPPLGVELAVLVAANLAATVLRFMLLRAWVFRSRPAVAAGPAGTTAYD